MKSGNTNPASRAGRKFLCVVARGHDRLYQRLLTVYGSDDEVEIVLDRRMVERRAAPSSVEAERRTDSRREREDAEETLRLRGWVLLRVDSVNAG